MAKDEFALLDESNIELFIEALKKYRASVEAILSEFNQRRTAISVTFADEGLQNEVNGYLDAIKTHLISVLEKIQSEEDRIVRSAFEQWSIGAAAVKANVNTEAASIRSASANITLD